MLVSCRCSCSCRACISPKGPKSAKSRPKCAKVSKSAGKGRNVESVSKRRDIKVDLREVSSSWSNLGVPEYIALTQSESAPVLAGPRAEPVWWA